MEADILHIAQENLEKVVPFKLKIGEGKFNGHNGNRVDGRVELCLGDEVLNFVVEVKKEVRTHQLPRIYALAETHKPFLLVAGQIFPRIKEKLKEKGINWLDAAGNMYVKTENHFLFIEQNEVYELEVEKDRAFTKTGLKVLFLFLQDEKWLNRTYREIADAANVALGTIGYVINGLKKRKYLVKKDAKNNKIVRKEELIDEWIGAYETELKPKLRKGTFTFIDEEGTQNWKELTLTEQAVWGGEGAADLLTGMLKPQELTLYTTQARADIMRQYRLKPHPSGFVKVYEPFWKMDEKENTAPPLVVYADLILTGDERNFKIAEQIYAEFLQA